MSSVEITSSEDPYIGSSGEGQVSGHEFINHVCLWRNFYRKTRIYIAYPYIYRQKLVRQTQLYVLYVPRRGIDHCCKFVSVETKCV